MPIRCVSCQSGPVEREEYMIASCVNPALALSVFMPARMMTIYVCKNCGLAVFHREEFAKMRREFRAFRAQAEAFAVNVRHISREYCEKVSADIWEGGLGPS